MNCNVQLFDIVGIGFYYGPMCQKRMAMKRESRFLSLKSDRDVNMCFIVARTDYYEVSAVES